MLEKDLESLKRFSSASLEDLEAGIWQRVAADQEALRLRRLIIGCQAGVVAVVILGSAFNWLPSRTAPSRGLDAFWLEDVPAPSTLLLGHHV